MTRPKLNVRIATMKIENSSASSRSSPNACTDCTTPERVMKVPKMVRKNVTMTSVTFQTRSMPRRSCTITECRNAVAVNQGSSPAFSTGSQPQQAEGEAERQEHPPHHRPAADGAQPRVVQVPGDERRDPERERDRHRDKPDVERGRVDRHVEVLEQRIEPLPFHRHPP